jgi:uncharacterized protein (TIGR03000 family)
VVSLPAEARLWFDGSATSSNSARRVFTSPDLPQGKELYYTLAGEMTVAGERITARRTIPVRAGEVTEVTLEFGATGVARK